MARNRNNSVKKPEIIINQIEVRPANRQILDIGKWHNALRAADTGRRTQLLNLYEDILIDGVLGDAIDKRIRAVTGANLTFQYADGSESEEMIKFIDTDEFEYLLIEIVNALFWGFSVIEPIFDQKGMTVYSVPRKHIRPETKTIARQENDPEGNISYDGLDILEAISREHKHGLILRACPYAILKRGGIGDWAQMVEIFGMPQRIGKYNLFDPESRKALQEAFDSQGAGSSMIIPEGTNITTEPNTGTGGGTLYKDFIKTLDEQILITLLSQTMTTKDGSSLAQGKVHKEVEEGLNLHDLRFVQRILNHKFLPILEHRGYPVKGGSFVFPKAMETLTVEQIIALSGVLTIPAYYVQEKYGIPAAEKKDVILQRQPTIDIAPDWEEPEPEPDPKPTKKKKEKKEKKGFLSFFAEAPAKLPSVAEIRGFMTKLTDNITGRVTLADGISIDLDKLLMEALREVYGNEVAGRVQPVVSKPLFEITNTALQEGVTSVFGEKNDAFTDEFRHNVAVFSAFKNHQQTDEIATLLHDEDGNLRSFREFKKLALQISKDYNVNWLQTEYNTAVSAARMAKNMQQWLKMEHLYPNLEYIETTSANARETHLEYVGTVLPIRHVWWDKHLPPSDWNCACSVQPTDKPETSVPGKELVPPVFQNNPGKTAEFVNLKEHPYIKGVCPYFATCKRRKGVQSPQLSDENPPRRKECAICEMAAKSVLRKDEKKKTAEAKKREKLIANMDVLLSKNVIRQVDANKSIKITFTKRGNEHIANDFLRGVKGLTKKDLTKLDDLMRDAEFVKPADLHKERTDKIIRFYYFKHRKKEVYYNVAEEVYTGQGRLRKRRFLYAITNEV